jgi:ABC-type nitrate/sulfonate/bicarbonate transport system permease component
MAETMERPRPLTKQSVTRLAGFVILVTVLLGAELQNAAAAPAAATELSTPASITEASEQDSERQQQESAAQSTAVTRLMVIVGVFAAVFLGIGVAFVRMVRRSRLD